MAPVLSKNWLKFLAKPVDFGKSFRGRRIFGENKTWRGIIMAVVFAIAIVALQRQLYLDYPTFENISLINYETTSVWILGFLLGFGAIFGDLVESFIKRQVGIKEGGMWFPFDQTDWIFGAIILSIFYISYTWQMVITLIIMFLLLHMLFSWIGYKLKMKKDKF
jgi:CDP-2,3-bis-(O-geranylgeranyl)-sn-glycerol synthase